MNDTLLQDLVQYRKSKDKGVQMAARGMLSLYREVGAEMLRKRDRGRDAAMKMRSGEMDGARRFGHVEGGGIEGLELLEKWKEEQGMEGSEDEEAGWNNWDAQSDDSESDTGWVNVESDGEEIDISDSEDEREKAAAKKAKLDARKSKQTDKENIDTEPTTTDEQQPKDTSSAPPTPRTADRNAASLEPAAALKREEAYVSKLATTRILTPADLAKLQELRSNASLTASLPSAKRRKLAAAATAAAASRHADDAVTATDIEGLAKLSYKATRDDKIALAKGERTGGRAGGEDGNDHRSTTARRKERKEAEGKSTTNKEKARKKNFLMTLGKAKKKGKRKLSVQRGILKAHSERAKRGGKRGNKGQ